MIRRPTAHPRWLQIGLWTVGFWTVVGLVYATMGYAARQLIAAEPAPFSLFWSVAMWYTWIPATFIALGLARRFPIAGGTWWHTVPVHLAGTVLCSLLACGIYTTMRAVEAWALAAPDFAYGAYLQAVFARSLALDSIVYLTVLAAVHAFDSHQKYRARELRATRLQAQLAEAQLHALQMQLQPHFLFNTFHAIALLVRQGRTEEATETIASLGGVLRYVLDHADEHEVTLEQEVAFLKDYVAVHQIRLKDQLDVRVETTWAARRARVPSLLLQPLIENAIAYGVTANGQPGRIRVDARREGAHLRVRVRDNGPGLPAGWRLEENAGVGLKNTRARLERLYGGDFHFDFTKAPGTGGLMVSIVIPYRSGVAQPVPAHARRPAVRAAPVRRRRPAGAPPHLSSNGE